MDSNATIHDAQNPSDAAVPLTARVLHLPITTDAEAFGRVARASERVLVLLAEPPATQRRALASFVVAGIEAELDRLGAAPRGWVSSDALEEIVLDQLYRARLLGCFGVAVSFAAVSALADAQGRLSAEDSETLRRLVALAEREPLQLHLPRPSAELMIAGAPQSLSAWLPPSLEPGRVATIEYEPTSDDANELPSGSAAAPGAKASLLPPLLEAFFDPPPFPDAPEATCEVVTPVARPSLPRARHKALRTEEPTARVVAETIDAAATAGALTETHGAAEIEVTAMADAAVADAAVAAASAMPTDVAGNVEAEEVEPVADAYTPAEAIPARVTESGAAGDPDGVESSGEVDLAQTPAPRAVAERTDAERIERCQAWAAQLQAMSGPKVHGSVEKAFIGAYLPLCRELAAGGVPDPARIARDRWAEGFAQSYASAFRQLGGGARRPRMVRDVVELGSRWLGQHHARQCQLLLVSAMRFDLGQRLNEEIERRLTGKAVCVEQCVLWTALPSNAEAQQLTSEARNAERRMRAEPLPRAPSGEIESGYVGSRELFRLRQLPDVLARPGDVETARLGQLAHELADTLVPWIQRQPPETLVVIFGDHGFHWDASAAGTSAAQRGGALPEQVLVPASAWLLREPRTRPKTAAGIH